MFITLVVPMVSWVFACVQTYQIVHIKYVPFFLYIDFLFTNAAENIFQEMVINIIK